MSWHGSTAPVWDAERLRIATDSAGVALWSWNVDTDEIALDDRAHQLWHVQRSGPVAFEALSTHIHPDDRDRVKRAFKASREVVGAYEIEFRVVRCSEVRWLSARGQGADKGIVGRVMFGVFLDVTDRKQAEEARDLIAREMTHRVKNLFAIAAALTNIASRSTVTSAEMAGDLTQRLTALGRAHELVRSLPGQEARPAAALKNLLAVLLAPYEEATGSRIRILPLEVTVGETAATTLALIVHELATNSLKYGALSAAGGTLDVSCVHAGIDVVVVWAEQGGPPITNPAKTNGFGSKLIARSISDRLGGSVSHDWRPEGVCITLRMAKARLAT